MQKYTNDKEIRYFEDDVNVSDWIDLKSYRLMTEAEVMKHESNPHTDYHVWDDELLEWIDNRTPEQIVEYERSLLPSLKRYQFFRTLLENGIKTITVVEKINAIEDEYTRELALLGFNDAANFVRTDESVKLVQGLLELTDEQVDDMWKEALKY